MPRSAITGIFTRVANSFSNPVFGTLIDPTDADSLFDDYDTGLTGQMPIIGTATNDAAPAGTIGEYIESVVTSGSAVALVTATPKTVTSILLSAGDWDVDAIGYVLPAATTSVTNVVTSISGITNTLDITPGKINGLTFQANVSGGAAYSMVVPPYRLSLAGPTTVYLVGQAIFTVSTAGAYGIISARRVR
jgi:hypothetical protein